MKAQEENRVNYQVQRAEKELGKLKATTFG